MNRITQQVRRMNPKALAAALAMVAAGAARADGITVDTASITAAATTVASIGAAVFLVIVGIKVYKWVRSAL